MKIKINGRKVVETTSPELQRIQAGFTNLFMDAITADAVTLSAARLSKLETILTKVANEEALEILEVLDDIIGTTDRGAVNWQRLLGTSTQMRLGKINPVGSVKWAPLKFSYGLWKEKKRKRAQGFFHLSGRMKSYFRRYGGTLIKGRLGGVRVSVGSQGFNAKNRRQLKPVWREDGNLNLKTVVGNISVNIFPNMSSTLAPMLSANKWHTGLNRDFEKKLFGSSAQRYKLTNPNGPYRPLFLPVVLFFAMVRIPGTVAYRINRFMNLSSVNLKD